MAEKSLATQAQLGGLKLALAQEADSLAFHSGDSMSKAHGFNILQGPANDGYGNDATTYQNSNGDVVGTMVLHAVVNGVDYYAPIIPTGLSGQDPLTGVQPDLSSLLQPGGDNCWVTEYTSTAVAKANLTVTGLLLPHTRQYYAETHRSVSVLPNFATYDSAGYVVGTAVLVVYFGAKQIYIPCSTRIGGPVQPPRLGGLNPNFGLYHTGSGANPDYAIYFQPYGTGGISSPVSGTKPITFSYEFYGALGWTSFTSASQIISPVTIPPVLVEYSSTTGQFHIQNGGGGGGMMQLRCTASNVSIGGSSTHAIYGTGVDALYTWFYSHDSPGCWFCTEANKERRLTGEQWKLLGTVEQEAFRLERRAVSSYIKHGDQLLTRMLLQGVTGKDFAQFVDKVLELAQHKGCVEAAKYYIRFVAEATHKYWPATPLAGLQHAMKCQGLPCSARRHLATLRL